MAEILQDIILNDHFGGDMAPGIVSQWLQAVLPSETPPPLPPNTKSFYGCSLRHSLPIELARGSYKNIKHETEDRSKIEKYARRMLISLDLIDLEVVEDEEPTLAALALWHRAMAEVRLESEAEGLGRTLRKFGKVRERVKLGEGKIPGRRRLIARLKEVAAGLENKEALAIMNTLETDGDDLGQADGKV